VPEQTVGEIGNDENGCVGGPSGRAEDRDVVGVASKVSNVVVDPSQRRDLVEDTVVA
jgi:hypothetical protein